MLNIDATATAFMRAAPLLEIMGELAGFRDSRELVSGRPLRPDVCKRLAKALFNIRVRGGQGRGRGGLMAIAVVLGV